MNNLDEILQVDTPENVVFGYEVAGIGSRFLATLIDTIILITINIFFYTFLALFFFGNNWEIIDSSSQMWAAAIIGLITFIFFWGYYIFFEVQWNGQSPGKRWAKLRVIRANGLPITLSEALIRNLVRAIDILPFAYGVGIVTMFIHPQSRRLGDLAAGTLVIREKESMSIHELGQKKQTITEQQPQTTSAATFPVERIAPQDMQIIENYLQRRSQFSNRGKLAVQIARALHTRLDIKYPIMSMRQAEDFLASIARSYHDYHHL